MSYLKYKCLISHVNGRLFKKGLVYLFPSDPGAKFSLTDEDPLQAAANVGNIDLDGTFRFTGIAGYDDFAFPLTSFKLGATAKPDYDYTDMGLAFPQNDNTEVAYGSDLTSHRMAVMPYMVWFPHIHYFQDEAEIPIFEYAYRFVSVGSTVPAMSDWVASSGELVATYDSGKIHQIQTFPPIQPYELGLDSVASLVDIQIRRNDNVVTGDVIAKQFDFHALFDAPLGSGQEFYK